MWRARRRNTWRRFKRKAHNFILKTTAWFMGILFFVSACAIDSPSWIPTIVSCASMAWLAAFAYANRDTRCKYDFSYLEDHDHCKGE